MVKVLEVAKNAEFRSDILPRLLRLALLCGSYYIEKPLVGTFR